ncbi:glycoside hydrolase family 3 N-terminal domain-containing protein [Oerskovia flava]|uniref:glycoside hydrolase family 3 N-terminal domain-containing protein n=1 Tax=Oerskovia flava TaxID=2986422 RepID=UPI0022402151|nr:glycoside hydrolase family 3 N-terminal domain-containing protein [Oerskovia sp. JB1-3-2]
MTAVVRAVNGVLLPGFTGTTELPAWLVEACRDGLAGVVYFGHNTPDVATTARLSARLHEVSADLLVAIDEEGGDVSRLEAVTGSSIPGNAALGVVDDPELTEEVGTALGRLLAATGIDLDLAPALDVNSDPDNPVIGVRSFGADPEVVTRHGAALVRGMHRGGAGACGKHFPGHGATDVDSHLDLPVVDASLDELRRRDLPPFVHAFGAPDASGERLDAVMTAHLLVPALGPAPSSLEPAVTALARELGFEGPVITDALDMGAVQTYGEDAPDGGHGIGEIAVRAVEAGADLLCLGTTVGRDDEALFRQAQSALVAAVEEGRVGLDRLRASADRTARAVATIRAFREEAGTRCSADAALDALADLERVGARAAVRAVRRHGPVPMPLTSAPEVVDLRLRFDHAAGRTAQHVQRAVDEVFAGAEHHRPADDAQWAATLEAVSGSHRPLVVLTREPLAGSAERHRLDALLVARPDLVVLHTGFPGAVDQWFPVADDGPSVVVACGTGRANARAAVDLLRRGAGTEAGA